MAPSKFSLEPDSEQDEPSPLRPTHGKRDSLDETDEDDGGRDTSPATPTFGDLRRNLSFATLKHMEIKELRSAVWRKPGHAKPMPKDMEQAVAHALTGGARSLLLGCSLRAGVNLVVVALRITKKKGITGAAILEALFGQDTVRFGMLLGSFSFLYKFILHSLRINNPGKKGPGAEERWHSTVAGAVSGLAVLAEKPSRRVTLGQQLLVRGLQGQYNMSSINIPHGDVLLFGLASAQIMYSWLMSPESLPRGYRSWVTKASRVAEPCLDVNLSAYRTGKFDPAQARKVLSWPIPPTPRNAALVEAYASAAENGDFGPPFAPCHTVHPFMDSCTSTAVDRWQSVFRWMMPVYAALHIIPPIVLRRKVFMKSPSKMLIKSLIGTLRSCGFLATFVTLFQALVCGQRNWYNAFHGKVPVWMETIIMNKGYYFFSGFATCLSLFVEEKKRRKELAMYVLPKGMEALWSVLRRKSYVPFVPGGEVVLTSIGMAMVMKTYQHEPSMLSGLVRSVLFQILG